MKHTILFLILFTCFGLVQAPSLYAEAPDAGVHLPDPIYLLEEIELSGSYSTSDEAVINALGLELDQQVNMVILKEARLRLLSTGFFEQAQFGLEPGSERGKVVLHIELIERNTLLLADIFLGASEVYPFWAGLDLVEGNFLGTGHSLRGAFVASAGQLAVELGWFNPTLLGSDFSIGFTGHGSTGREEMYPLVAVPSGMDPYNLELNRLGGRLSFGWLASEDIGLYLDLRGEYLNAQTSAPYTELLNDLIELGDGTLSVLALTFDFDTRDDPVIPREGLRFNLSAQGSSEAMGSDYDYIKVLGHSLWAWEFVPGHILRLSGAGGAIWGQAPYFERFFIGDFNDLVPARNLGRNFANQSGPDFFNTGADQISYENFIFRVSAEYAIPIDLKLSWVYRTEFFLGSGLVGATTPEADRAELMLGIEPEPGLRDPMPLDLSVDLGLRVETSIGIFGFSFANGMALVPL